MRFSGPRAEVCLFPRTDQELVAKAQLVEEQHCLVVLETRQLMVNRTRRASHFSSGNGPALHWLVWMKTLAKRTKSRTDRF